MTDIDRVSGDLVGVDDLLESTQDETAARRRRRWGWIAVQVARSVHTVAPVGIDALRGPQMGYRGTGRIGLGDRS